MWVTGAWTVRCARTAYLLYRTANTRSRQIVITSLIPRLTCWTGTFAQPSRIKNGLADLAAFMGDAAVGRNNNLKIYQRLLESTPPLSIG